MVRDRAPSAIRIATSRRAWAAAYETTPYKPTRASAAAKTENAASRVARPRAGRIAPDVASETHAGEDSAVLGSRPRSTSSIIGCGAAAPGRVRTTTAKLGGAVCVAATYSRGTTSVTSDVRTSPITPTTRYHGSTSSGESPGLGAGRTRLPSGVSFGQSALAID